MIIYGIRPVLEALSGRSERVQRIQVARGRGGTRLRRIVTLAKEKKIPIRFESLPAINRQAQSLKHQGVLAELSALPYEDLDRALSRRPKALLLLDGVEDPRNLGAVIRTAEAAGVGAVLLPTRNSCGITSMTVKASAGAVAHIPICRIGNVVQTIEKLKSAGFWIVGLDMSGTEGPEQISPEFPVVIVVGGENRGMRRLVRDHCDYLVKLPMKGKVSSLNVSVAAGILIYSLLLRPPTEQDDSADVPS